MQQGHKVRDNLNPSLNFKKKILMEMAKEMT